jgi:RNAse (barnase) inhibitor barstar
MLVRIPTERIVDWDSFHDVFAETMGFPAFYGRNSAAWVDCMTDLDEDNGMTTMHVAPGEVLTLQLEEATEFARRCPDQYAFILECSAFVNWRRIEQGQPAVLALSFFRNT